MMQATATVQRKIAQVNQSQAARDLGLNRSYVNQVLKGKRMPGLDVAAGLAKYLGVSIDALHGWIVTGSRMVN